MGNDSAIDWTGHTVNVTTGCTKISQGCKNCYAELLSRRLKAWGTPKYRNGFELTLHEYSIYELRKHYEPPVVFVNSMSDLFHEDIPVWFIHSAFDAMRESPWNTFQVLTKRAERMAYIFSHIKLPEHIWVGVSVEDTPSWSRVAHLRQVKASTRFLSVEPLIGPLPSRLDLRGIDWVIAGGESQPGCRSMELDWARHLRDECVRQNVPFYLKQLGGHPNKRSGAAARLDGKRWRQMPTRMPKTLARRFR